MVDLRGEQTSYQKTAGYNILEISCVCISSLLCLFIKIGIILVALKLFSLHFLPYDLIHDIRIHHTDQVKKILLSEAWWHF